MEEVNAELSIQYAMARRQRPGATSEEIADIVTSRMSAEHQLVLAGDALLWTEEPASRVELARRTVLAFILEIETGPDRAPG